MQVLVPDSWLREYLETSASPRQIQTALSLCGPSVERVTEKNGDFIYDIEVTTNRVDCASVYGIAREAAAILPRFDFKTKLLCDPFQTPPSFKTAPAVDYIKVQIDPDLCPRFAAILVQNVSVSKSPDWVVKKLEAVGMRSLNNVVDISNLLMHELGQPVHVFDYDKIGKSSMCLRPSRAGEIITTLDNHTFRLPGGDIVIEDGSGQLIDLCGIMGGLASAVDHHTKNILLFVQTYEPTHIRKTSMRLAHRTRAAVLFEKGLSVESVLPVMEKGVNLLRQLTNGAPADVAIDNLAAPPQKKAVSVSAEFVNSRLGTNLTKAEIQSILSSLGLDKTVPWWRAGDIEIPEDLVEEVARIYGYHNLPGTIMPGQIPAQRDTSEFHWISKIKSTLKAWGFTETYTYSLTPHDPHPQALKLKNPLTEDWKFLRTSLAPSLVAVVNENLSRAPELRLFEIANVYLPQKSGLPQEIQHLCLAVTKKDWHYFKGIVEALFDYELGLSAPFALNDQVLEHPDCLTYEIALPPLIKKAGQTAKYKAISKYAPVIEDFNVSLSDNYDKLVSRIKKLSPLIQNIELVDKYGSKLTLRVTFHSKTKQLSKADISPLRPQISRL